MSRDPLTIAEAVRRLADGDPLTYLFQPEREGTAKYTGSMPRAVVLEILKQMDGHINEAGDRARERGMSICVPLFMGVFGGMGTLFLATKPNEA